MLTIISILLAIGVVAGAGNLSITSATDGKGALIILGRNPDDSLWKYEWHRNAFGYFSKIGKAANSNSIKVSYETLSLGESPFALYLEKNNTLIESSIGYGGNDFTNNLNGSLKEPPNYFLASRDGYPMLAGLGTNGHCWQWDQYRYYDSETGNGWADIGGDFLKSPVGVHSSMNYSGFSGIPKIDFFGISTKNKLLYKNLTFDLDEKEIWYPNGTEWAVVDSGDYYDQVRVSAYRNPKEGFMGNYSLWTLNNKGHLFHKRRYGAKFSDWEDLGGEWSQVPVAVEWAEYQYDVFGRDPKTKQISYKTWNGTHWWPPAQIWRSIGGPFSSEPAVGIVTIGRTYTAIAIGGVAENNTLLFQPYLGGSIASNVTDESGLYDHEWPVAKDNVTESSVLLYQGDEL